MVLILSLEKKKIMILYFVIGSLILLASEKYYRITNETSLYRLSNILALIAEDFTNLFYKAGEILARIFVGIGKIIFKANSDIKNLFNPILSILLSWIKAIYGVSDFLSIIQDKYTIAFGIIIFLIFFVILKRRYIV